MQSHNSLRVIEISNCKLEVGGHDKSHDKSRRSMKECDGHGIKDLF